MTDLYKPPSVKTVKTLPFRTLKTRTTDQSLPEALNLSNIRLIARLDIKSKDLVKGVHLEGLRVMGDPQEFARRYYEQGADELIYIDIVASLYGRSNMIDIVRRTAQHVFIPLTVGGGIRSSEDVKALLRAGADKVAISTQITKTPELIREVSRRFGSQCMVMSIEAKQTAPGKWEVYVENGRTPTGLDVIEWAKHGVELGAGEILLTSIDREGTQKGFDLALIRAVSENVSVPVIASGGMGALEDVVRAVREGQADAIAVASLLHYNLIPLSKIRHYALASNIPVRRL